MINCSQLFKGHQFSGLRLLANDVRQLFAEDGQLRCQLKENWRAILRASMMTLALWILVHAELLRLPTGAKLLSKVPVGDAKAWIAIGLLVVAAAALQLVWSVWLRLWHYLRRTWFAAPIATVAAILAWLGNSNGAPQWLVGLALVVFWVAITALFWLPTPRDADETDFLQRSYFVDRLLEHFAAPAAGAANTKLRRIAILGGWGTGKTFLLKMLRRKLKKKPSFGVAFVNPWQARDPEEFRERLAAAFDEALGYSGYMTPWPGWKWLKKMPQLKFGPEQHVSITIDLDRLLRGDAAGDEDMLVRRINHVLEKRKRTCVILVDDMERADKDVVRKAFPLIDLLGRIEHCFFVFALDPERIAEAFDEDRHGSPRTKGYLDKVFELQLVLPEGRPIDLAKLCAARIDDVRTPKLAAAWPVLAPHVPTTPREAIHFVNSAATAEVLFLSRYDINEHRYDGFFLAMMLILEVPSAATRLAGAVADVRGKVRTRAYMGVLGDDRESKEEKALFDGVWEEITKDSLVSVGKKDRLYRIVRGLVTSTVNIEWALHHHKRLLVFDAKRRLKLELVWARDAGKRSIKDMIAEVAGNEYFEDVEAIGRNLIELQFDRYSECRGTFIGASTASRAQQALDSAAEILRLLHQHFQWSFANVVHFDANCVESSDLDKWWEIIFSGRLSDSVHIDHELTLLEREFAVVLSEKLNLADAVEFSLRDPAFMVWSKSDANNRNDLIPDVEAVQSRLRHRIRIACLDAIRSGSVLGTEFYRKFSIGSLAHLFGSPKLWGCEDDWQAVFGELSDESRADSGLIFRSAAMIADSLLGAVRAIIQDGDRREGNPVWAALTKSPEYFAGFWCLGLRCDERREDLEARLRNLLKRIGPNSSIDPNLVERAFPSDVLRSAELGIEA